MARPLQGALIGFGFIAEKGHVPAYLAAPDKLEIVAVADVCAARREKARQVLPNARIYSDLKELLFGVIRALTAAIDAKDPYTSGHSERVARIAVRLAEELGMSANQRSDLYLMGLLHDVGKIGIDDSVLKKTGPLTPDEYRLIQSHVVSYPLIDAPRAFADLEDGRVRGRAVLVP